MYVYIYEYIYISTALALCFSFYCYGCLLLGFYYNLFWFLQFTSVSAAPYSLPTFRFTTFLTLSDLIVFAPLLLFLIQLLIRYILYMSKYVYVCVYVLLINGILWSVTFPLFHSSFVLINAVRKWFCRIGVIWLVDFLIVASSQITNFCKKADSFISN